MEYSRTEIRPGVWLTHLREDKFKTACFSVSLLSQLNRETASMNALIPFVLRRGTSAFPDMETLSARMEELYGTVIEPIIRRIGEIQCCGFYASFPEDAFLPQGEGVLKDTLPLTLDLLLSPVTRGGLLLPAYVESERDKLLDLISARMNNKRSYAVLRCIEEMCCCEDFAVSRYGDEESCRSINYKKLSRHYRTLLQTSPIELFYCGRASLREVKALLRDHLSTLPRGEIDAEIGTEIRMNALEAGRIGNRLPGLRMRTPDVFERPKILSRQTADRIVAACDSVGKYYYANTLHGTAPRPGTYSLHFLAVVMNSAAVDRWYRLVASESGKPFPQVKIAILKRLPVCRATRAEQCAVLRAYRSGGQSAADPLIARLYGL